MNSLKRWHFCLFLLPNLILISAVAAISQTPAAKPKPTGAISGRVTVNGKSPGAIQVAAFTQQNVMRRVPAAKATTDSEGYYRLAGLVAGEYQIAAIAPAMTSSENQPEFGPLSYFLGSSSKNVLLDAGEEVQNIDIKLVRGGVITGRITDSENKPVIEERVSLQIVDENGNPPRTPTYTRLPVSSEMYVTDDQGNYRIYGLPAGFYKVSVGSDGQGSISSSRGYYQRTYYPDAKDSANATVVQVSEGGEASKIDIHLSGRGETYRIAGRAIDSINGAPISGARITAMVKRPNETRYSPLGSLMTTNARGEFSFDGFTAGQYGLYLYPDMNGGDVYSDISYFEVVDKDVSGLEVKGIHGLSLSGVVVGEGQVGNNFLAELAELRVTAYPNTGEANFGAPSMALVAGDGTFQVNGLRPGRLGLAIASTSGKRVSIIRVEHDGIGLTQGFELQPGQSISGLRVVITYGTGVIRGSVQYVGGSPPPNSRTYIFCTREGSQGGNSAAQLDSRGRFVITGLAPGNYTLTLQTSSPPQPGQRPTPPQKQQVTVSNDTESQVTFVVDLTPKEGAP